MIHVEKLLLKNITEPRFQHQYQNSLGHTFVEYLSGVTLESDDHYSKFPWIYKNNNLAKHINIHLPKQLNNISIGKYFGKVGIELDQLLLSPPNIDNLVIEIPIYYLNIIPTKRLKFLLETHVVLLNDFQEFGCTYGIFAPHIVSFLTESNIMPKCLFLVGAGFQLNSEYKKLNLYTIPFEYWLLSSVAVQDFFLNAVVDTDHKNTLMSELYHQPKKNKYVCAVPTLKPRRHRIELLSHLDKIGILNQCDWSCALNQSKRFNNYVSTPNQSSNKVSSFTDEEINFINSYSFPKELEFNEQWQLKESPYSAIPTMTAVDWFNQYKFILASETYVGNEINPLLGGCGQLSEKTFKSFLYGSSVIVHGAKGSTEELSKLGFKTQFGNYDSSSVSEIGDILMEVYKNPVVDTELTVHNFDRITDLHFLTSLVATPLNKIADLINSIRR